LQTLASNINSGIDSRVKYFNDNEAARQAAMPTSGAEKGRKYTGDYVPGVKATRENQSSQDESTALSRLGQLIGSVPQVAPGGASRQSGYWSQEDDPSQAPMLNAKNGGKYTYKQGYSDPNARGPAAASDILLGILTGGIGNVIMHNTAGHDPKTNLGAAMPHGQWLDENGEPADVYYHDPVSGVVTDKQTGEKFNQSDIDKGNVVLDPNTGKYVVVIAR
jgi:hypothetical protein